MIEPDSEFLTDNRLDTTITESKIDYPNNAFELTIYLLKFLDAYESKLSFPVSAKRLRKYTLDSFPDLSKTKILYLLRYRVLHKIIQILACKDRLISRSDMFRLRTKNYNSVQNFIIKNTFANFNNGEFNNDNKFISKLHSRSVYFLNIKEPCVDTKVKNGIVYITRLHRSVINSLLKLYDVHFSIFDPEPTLSSSAVKNVVSTNEERSESETPTGQSLNFNDPKIKEQIVDMINLPTMNSMISSKTFRNFNTKAIDEICEYGTFRQCKQYNQDNYSYCNDAHYVPIHLPHTDAKLGACSYLDTCRHIENCRYVHYEVVPSKRLSCTHNNSKDEYSIGHVYQLPSEIIPPQWINCDARKIDFSIFKPFVNVIMADPPWDIHMDLPYGTLTDPEMRELEIQNIQDEGLLFLWVTGRSMELARECMDIWGYKRVEEILWIKINQLQRLVRTGRTGHWINHSKEHCLVGIKGNPDLNRNIDCDVIVSEVRETSRKPDEIYRIIERMCPSGLKLELFGRDHNFRNNWITLGNQLNGVNIIHPEISERFKKTMNL